MRNMAVLLVLALLIASPVLAQTGKVTLVWDPNPETDLAGYKVYFGPASRVYGAPITIPGTPAAPTFTVTNLPAGLFYFAVTAYNTSGMESGYSNEVSTTVAPQPPQPPTGLAITSQSASLRWFGAVLLATTNEKASAILRYHKVEAGAGTTTVIATPKPNKTQHRAVLYLTSGVATYAYEWTMTSVSGEVVTGIGTFETR